MSGIGDYIHFHYDYYKTYGLKTKRLRDKDSSITPSDVLSKAHNNIYSHFQNLGNWTNANNLSTQLNYFYGGKGGEISSTHLDNKVRDAIEAAINTYLSDYEDRGLVLDIDNLKFDYASGHGNIKQGVGKFRSGLNREGEVGKKAQIEGLIKKVDNFIKASSSITSKDGLTETDYRTLDRLRVNWESVRRQLKQLSKTRTFVSSNMELIGMSGKTYENYGNFLQEFNSLLDNFRLGQAVYNGLLGEFIVPAILQAVENKGNEAINEIMKDFANNYKAKKQGSLGNRGSYINTGFESSQKILNKENFGVRIDSYIDLPEGSKKKERGEFTYEQDVDGNLISVKATQDKVDAIIKYDDIDYNISMKNYQTDLHKRVQLHSGNLLRLIQTESDFINHYLNITSERIGSQDMNSQKQAPQSVRNKAIQVMNELVLSKSLTGGVLKKGGKTNVADYFVLNDSSNGKFYVIPMSALIEQGMSANGNKYINIKYNGVPNELIIQNKWQVAQKDKNGYGKTNSMQKAYVRLRLMVQDLARVHVETKYDIQQIMTLRGRS